MILALAALAVMAMVGQAADPPVGFRGDGTGVFAGATPPTTWDLATGTNVAWKAELPAYTTASPIVVASKVIVACEPDTVVCYDAQSGKELWKQSGGAFDGLGAEKATRANTLFATLRDLERQGKASLQDKASEYAVAAEEFGKLTKLSLHYWPGFSTPTAVSDGNCVAIRTCMGPVVCYDLDGTRKWVAQPGKGLSRLAPCSPVIAGGQVLTFDGTNALLSAFDIATGKTTWSAAVGRGHYKYATPALFRLGDRDLLFTDSGDVVTTDGHILATGLLHMDGGSSPTVVAGVAYANSGSKEGGLTAVQLTATAPDRVEGTTLWTAKARLAGSSPLVFEGLVYFVDGNGVLQVLDAKTGAAVFTQAKTKDSKAMDASPTIAGRFLFVPSSKGAIRVYTAGPKPELVATNMLEASSSSPVAAGNYLYYAGKRTLYCIGAEPKTDVKQ
jgi:outer membrane protein assembly factor BamB